MLSPPLALPLLLEHLGTFVGTVALSGLPCYVERSRTVWVLTYFRKCGLAEQRVYGPLKLGLRLVDDKAPFPIQGEWGFPKIA